MTKVELKHMKETMNNLVRSKRDVNIMSSFPITFTIFNNANSFYLPKPSYECEDRNSKEIHKHPSSGTVETVLTIGITDARGG